MKSDYTQQNSSDQEIFDRKMLGRNTKQIAKNLNALMESKERDSLPEKREDSSSVESLDAIARTMLRHPTLTREKAEALARFHGF
jgi:hypothetical protein